MVVVGPRVVGPRRSASSRCRRRWLWAAPWLYGLEETAVPNVHKWHVDSVAMLRPSGRLGSFSLARHQCSVPRHPDRQCVWTARPSRWSIIAHVHC
jgi:hypothetical protein